MEDSVLAQIHPPMAGYELLQSCHGFDLAGNFLTDSSSFGDTGHWRPPKSQKKFPSSKLRQEP